MTRRTLNIEYQTDWLETEGLTPEEFDTDIRVAIAAHLCRKYQFSTGGAADFVDIPKILFLQRMGEFRIPAFGLTSEELEQDVGSDGPCGG